MNSYYNIIMPSLRRHILQRTQMVKQVRVFAAYLSTSRKWAAEFYSTADEAVYDIKDGARILLGGFGTCGVPENLLDALALKQTSDLVCVSNDGGGDGYGVSLLMEQMQIKKFIFSHTGENEELQRQYFGGDMEVELIPQGTLMEKLRAGAAGIPAFFTPTGYGTLVHKGGIPIKYNANGTVAIKSKPKMSQEFGGVNHIMEESITGDFALVKAWKADRAGNLTFKKTARNTNPLMCKAGKIAIAEVEDIVETGSIAKEDVHIPHIYVQRIIKGSKYRKPTFKNVMAQSKGILGTKQPVSPGQMTRDRIVKRAALELKDGMYLNLGIGLPSFVTNHIKPDIKVHIQCEHGILGMGPFATQDNEDPDLVDAGGNPIESADGGSFFASDESFTMIRGGHLEMAILGAMEVSQYGDLANWMIPGKTLKGMGGAMDLVALESTKVIITMEHTAKDGKPKFLKECRLPLTGIGCVDMVITDMGVFEISRDAGLIMTEIADGFSVEDVKKATGCELQVSAELRPMQTS